MPSLVLRLLVLLLAVLLQAGSWHAEACSRASASVAPPPASPRGAGDFDAAEDATEELSALDDGAGPDLVLGSVSVWSSPAQSSRWATWIEGLSKGGPPSDTPYKPPRA